MKQKVVILGAGESGVGAALLAQHLGYDAFVSDFGKIAKPFCDQLAVANIAWEENGHTFSKMKGAALIIKSPGIPDTASIVQQLRKENLSVISEIEFAARFSKATLIGITGSNGKTTTTLMTGHVLHGGKLQVAVAGNIGDSFAKKIMTNTASHYVLELSSFQLDGIIDFKPHIAIITNITPDHLDRYNNNFDDYIASKFRITQNQDATDYLIYDADDDAINKGLQRFPTKAKLLPFSLSRKLKQGAYIDNEHLLITIDNSTLTMTTKDLELKGQHNVKNAMAAAMTAKLLGIRKATIRESLEGFQGVEHRLENVLKIQNVQYINDSKATNVNATFYALQSMSAPTVWIVGGVDKGNDYRDLYALVNEHVKAIVFLGKDNEKLKSHFEGMVDTAVEAQSMTEAVKLAYGLAERGDNVLLSPACASFDLFDNYEDRGRQFKNAVRNL